MNVNLATCMPAEAAVMLASDLKQIVIEIIAPAARERDVERTGGLFAFWRTDPSGVVMTPVVGLPSGLVSPDRFRKYIYFASEKAIRLADHPDDVSSWQSRDESDPDRMNHKYGGAIRCGRVWVPHLIFSFSGFSELEDEAICVILARRFDLLTDAETNVIIEASDNDLLAAYRDSRNADNPW